MTRFVELGLVFIAIFSTLNLSQRQAPSSSSRVERHCEHLPVPVLVLVLVLVLPVKA